MYTPAHSETLENEKNNPSQLGFKSHLSRRAVIVANWAQQRCWWRFRANTRGIPAAWKACTLARSWRSLEHISQQRRMSAAQTVWSLLRHAYSPRTAPCSEAHGVLNTLSLAEQTSEGLAKKCNFFLLTSPNLEQEGVLFLFQWELIVSVGKAVKFSSVGCPMCCRSWWVSPDAVIGVDAWYTRRVDRYCKSVSAYENLPGVESHFAGWLCGSKCWMTI